jgi:ribokinase
MAGGILVVGSINMDLVVVAERRPAPGETLFGDTFRTVSGGKGANQAVAAARLGGATALAGRLGNDLFGKHLLGALRQEGIDTARVVCGPGETSGVAVIEVDRSGENSIIVVSGANAAWSESEIADAIGALKGRGTLLLQLEIPLPVVVRLAKAAREGGVRVVLDPAPPSPEPLPADLMASVDLLVPNEHEAAALTGIEIATVADAERAATALRQAGARAVIVKLGARGVVLQTDERTERMPGFRVQAIDTTAAGDTFAGGLAVALEEGRPLREAIRFAQAAAAISVTRLGAQSSIPTRAEVDAWLDEATEQGRSPQ